MDCIEKLKKDAGIPPIVEGRVFNNTGEMLRTLIDDLLNIKSDIHAGHIDSQEVERDLEHVIEYYKNAEIKPQQY